MPKQQGTFTPMERLPIEERLKEPARCQEHWYHYAAQLARGRSVIDVGAGQPDGLDILRSAAPYQLVGIDPLPVREDVLQLGIEQVSNGAFDLVVTIDVIEHVEEDAAFLAHLLRVARQAVFLTTPNYAVWDCKNPHHVREYTADELTDLIGKRDMRLWTARKDRFESPPREIAGLSDADSVFACLIRSDACDEQTWSTLRSSIPDSMGRLATDRLHRAGIFANEWTTRLRDHTTAAVERGQSPVEAVAAWINAQFEPDGPDALPYLGDRKGPIDFLRHGYVSELQRARTLAWAFVTTEIHTNPRIAKCSPVSPDDGGPFWAVYVEDGTVYDARGVPLAHIQIWRDPA